MSVDSAACNNDNSACLQFLLMFSGPYFTSLPFPKHNSATVRNMFMVLGRIIKRKCGVLHQG